MTTLEAQHEVITDLILENKKLKQERDEAHKIAEKAIEDLAWVNETNARLLRNKLEQLKDATK